MRRYKKPIEDSERVISNPERSREKTMHRAVRLLAAKPRSVGELRKRLLEKVWTNAEIVDAVIEKLKDYKYLDDEQFARDTALSKLRQRPQGKLKLMFAMSRKELSKEDIETAVNSAFEQLPEADLLETAIKKRIRLSGKPESREELKKFYDHLMRKGFSYGLIREKMAEIINRLDEDE